VIVVIPAMAALLTMSGLGDVYLQLRNLPLFSLLTLFSFLPGLQKTQLRR